VKLAIQTKNWTLLFVVALFITSLGAYMSYFVATHFSELTMVYQTPITLLRTAAFYLSIFLSVGFIFLTDYLLANCARLFNLKKIDVLRLLMKDNYLYKDYKTKKRLN